MVVIELCQWLLRDEDLDQRLQLGQIDALSAQTFDVAPEASRLPDSERHGLAFPVGEEVFCRVEALTAAALKFLHRPQGFTVGTFGGGLKR